MKSRLTIVLCALLTVGVMAAYAETTEDVLQMAQKNVGEEVLMAAVENSKEPFKLSTADILKLKDNKVSDRVIAAMIRHRKAEAPADQPKEAAVAETGTLNIENLDDRGWSFRLEPETKTVWIAPRKSDGRNNLDAHGGISLRVPAGSYEVRYNGNGGSQALSVSPNETSLLMISRVDSTELEALYVTAFEKGERKGSARLATLRESRKASNGNGRAPERIVERERVVEAPSTTVVYRDYPYYSSNYYPVTFSTYRYPSYYSGYCYPNYHYPRYSSNYCAPYYSSNYHSYSYPHYHSYNYPRYYSSYNYPRYNYSPSVQFGYSHTRRSGSGWSVGAGF